MIKELITDKIRLVAPEKSDSSDLYYLRTHPGVNKYIERTLPHSVSEVEEFIEQRNSNTNDYYFVIKTLSNSELAGAICLKKIDKGTKYAEVGYELLPDFQGKGIMTGALRKIIEFAFTELDIETIEAFTHINNIPSRKLLENTNFKLVSGNSDPGNSNNIIYCLTKACT
jgi:[ribosomal protein S5]-alanine N-acetyltransferase